MNESPKVSKRATKFRAVCFVCYSCHLTQPVGKREAEREAVSHMNAYKHNTSVQVVDAR
jgi:hypothetical protein